MRYFVLKDTNRFLIKGNPHMLHLATISYGLREFWVMLCIKGTKKGECYIEELVHNTVSFSDDIFGNFKYIQDDELALDLTRFAEEHKLTDMATTFNELADQGKIDILLQ